jgi:hypothetical protein
MVNRPIVIASSMLCRLESSPSYKYSLPLRS